jgi:hypothetical protein
VSELIILADYRKTRQEQQVMQAAALPAMMFLAPMFIFSALAIMWLARP